MGRMVRCWIALLVGVAVVFFGPRASAATFDPYPAGVVKAERVTTTNKDGKVVTVIRISGPGFSADQVGCSSGIILAVPAGQPFESAIEFNKENLNTDWVSELPVSLLPAGTYDVAISCTEGGKSATYSTTATFTILPSDVPPPVVVPPGGIPPTQAPPTGNPPATPGATPSVDGTVDPGTAKPGITELTIRGGGFQPGATLQISLSGTPATAIGTTTATATGFYAATLKLPANAPPGARQLVVSGPDPGGAPRTTSATVTVQDLDCADFATPQAAQAALGPAGADPHGLDADKDGVACQKVAARSTTGSSGAAAAPAAAGTLPATGSRHAGIELMAGLAALTLGALLIGLSHPAVPASGPGPRRPRRGNHWR